MIKQILYIENRINQLSLRERGLLFGIVILILFNLFDVLFFSAIRQDYVLLKNKTQQIMMEVQAKKTEADTINVSVGGEGNTGSYGAEIEHLQRDITGKEAELLALVNAVTPPEQLIALLYGVLKPAGNLQLVDIEVKPPEPLIEFRTDSALPAYRQNFKLHLRGGFFEVLEYLRVLHRSSWSLFWGQLRYAVEVYPLAQVELDFYTLTSGSGIYGEPHE